MSANRWVGIITPHARQRYVERISDPNKYEHIRSCRRPSCSTCVSQGIQIRKECELGKKYIDWGIRERIALAVANDSKVNNPSFLEIVKKTYPQDRNFSFWQHKNGIYVVVTPEDQPPALLTVMSGDMVDGMVIQTATSTELTMYFSRWKMESKTLAYQREIKNL